VYNESAYFNELIECALSSLLGDTLQMNKLIVVREFSVSSDSLSKRVNLLLRNGIC